MSQVFLEISIIVAGASLLAWLASRCRQPIIIAYVVCGALAGPSGFGLIHEVDLLDTVSKIGITLLLFLAGMVLHPDRLVRLFRTAALVTLGICLGSLLLLFPLVCLSGFQPRESLYISLALMFSSTILVVKLLPTTTLHQRHMGSVCIAVLIAQDLIAVVILLAMQSPGQGEIMRWGILLPLKGGLFLLFAFVAEQQLLRRMMRQSDAYHEVLYMLCLGWCLGLSALAAKVGLSLEVGAFMAGVTLARNPLSRFLTEQLKPMRDFFLMFFFFVLGAGLNLHVASEVWWPALLASLTVMLSRPVLAYALFRAVGEAKPFACEVGLRVGQASEFGLIIAWVAHDSGHISESVSQMIQLAVIFTLVISSYLAIFRYPTPLGTRGGLKQD